MITGTPLFLSRRPSSRRTTWTRSDLYAVGGVAYYPLCGRHVFDGQSVVEICGHHLHTAPVPPSEKLGAPIPEELEALVLSCLEKDAARRPQSARELQGRLDAIAQSVGWTEDQAREWWSSHAATPTARTPDRLSLTDLTQALSVDMRERERTRI